VQLSTASRDFASDEALKPSQLDEELIEDQIRPEIIMPQTFAIILFLNSFKILLLFPNNLLLFSHYSQQMK